MQRKHLVGRHRAYAAAAQSPDHDLAELRARQKAFASCLVTVRIRGGAVLTDASRQRNEQGDGELAFARAIDALYKGRYDGDAGDMRGDDSDANHDGRDGGRGCAEAGARFDVPESPLVPHCPDVAWACHGETQTGAAAGTPIADPIVNQACGHLLEAVRVNIGLARLTVRVPLGDGPLSGTDAVLTCEGNQLTVQIRVASGEMRRRLASYTQALRRRLAGAAPDRLVMVEVSEGGVDERTEYS